ncbi:MAG TPA: tetratricopeptide repeat protein [Parvibaculum sp.]
MTQKHSVYEFLIAGALAAGASFAPAFAMGPTDAELKQESATYQSAVADIKAKNYQAGIDKLMGIYNGTGGDADTLNELGYAHRMLGQYDDSLRFYKEALQLDPDHREAHEYLGELYLQTNKPDDARAELATLTKLCGKCEEQEDLAEAIEHWKPAKTGN